MTTHPRIFLRRGKEESLLRRHPWIFSGAIGRVECPSDTIAEGEIVDVHTAAGDFIARGHYQIGSIAVRVLTFAQEPIDAAWWRARIRSACEVRRTLGLIGNAATTCYRLVHGEGDSLPGLVIDIYGTTAVVQCHSVGMYRSRMQIAEALREVYGERLAAVYDKSSQTVPYKAGLNAVDGYLMGKVATPTQEVSENGHRFLVNWEEGQKTGFFLDQRCNRELVERYAAGRTVLNTFCYTGGFSVYAAAGGAKEVCSVDASERAVQLAEALPAAEVALGDGSSRELLLAEGLTQADALVTLTGIDEENIVVSMFGHSQNVPKIVTKINRLEYGSIFAELGVGSIVSPKELCSNDIARYVRAMQNTVGSVLTLHSIAGGEAEALEFRVDGAVHYCGVPLRDVPLRAGVLIACIPRRGKTIIPDGAAHFEKGDTVVAVTACEEAVTHMNDLFEP